MAFPANAAASSVHGGVGPCEHSATAADQAPRPPRKPQEHNKIGSEWLGPEPRSDHGPLGGADVVKGSATGSDSCAMDCTQPHRRKSLYSPSWSPSPSNADDAPSLGAIINWWSSQKPLHNANMMLDTAPPRELNRSAPFRSQLRPSATPILRRQTLLWISTPRISSLRQLSGPGTGSLHRPLDIHPATVCATSVGSGDASLVRAVPGPKSGPHFLKPSWSNTHHMRGVRVVGFLASGPTGAANSALRQQVLIIAKLRGRQSIFLFGVIAASPCCTWYTGQSAEVQVLYRRSALHDPRGPSPEACTLPSCQSASALYWWKWHVSDSVQASIRSCHFPQGT